MINHFTQTPLLYVHIGAGICAVLAGAVTLFVKKGSPRHIKFGLVFVWTMVISALLGSVLGLMNYSALFITFSGGLLASTLIASGVLTLKTKRSKPSRLELMVAVISGLNLLVLLVVGTTAAIQHDAVLFGFHAADYFFLAGMALLCLVGDVIYFLGKRAAYRHTIARHLWRMCLGFFMAAGSAFTGPGQAVFPASVQASGLLALPELLILMLMVLWLLRTLYFNQKPIISD